MCYGIPLVCGGIRLQYLEIVFEFDGWSLYLWRCIADCSACLREKRHPSSPSSFFRRRGRYFGWPLSLRLYEWLCLEGTPVPPSSRQERSSSSDLSRWVCLQDWWEETVPPPGRPRVVATASTYTALHSGLPRAVGEINLLIARDNYWKRQLLWLMILVKLPFSSHYDLSSRTDLHLAIYFSHIRKRRFSLSCFFRHYHRTPLGS